MSRRSLTCRVRNMPCQPAPSRGSVQQGPPRSGAARRHVAERLRLSNSRRAVPHCEQRGDDALHRTNPNALALTHQPQRAVLGDDQERAHLVRAVRAGRGHHDRHRVVQQAAQGAQPARRHPRARLRHRLPVRAAALSPPVLSGRACRPCMASLRACWGGAAAASPWKKIRIAVCIRHGQC
jgi:hypothetical protein